MIRMGKWPEKLSDLNGQIPIKASNVQEHVFIIASHCQVEFEYNNGNKLVFHQIETKEI